MGMGAQFSLSPSMASLKLAALAFIKEYWARYGGSPSFGEIANALGTNRERVRKIVGRLVEDGKILHVPGAHRNLVPIERVDQVSVGEALLLLTSLGWKVNEGGLEAPVTKTTLPRLPELDHIPED